MEHTTDVEGLKRRVTSEEFELWKAYYQMQRWGEEWQQTARITAAVLKSNKPESEFMPKYVPPAGSAKESVERSVALMNQLVAINQKAGNGNR